MVTLKTKLTAEELLQLPAGRDRRYELYHGELVDMAPAGYRHGKDAARIARLIGIFVAANHLGDVVAAETGFLLQQNPDHVRAPDCGFVSAGRLPADADPVGYPQLAPDFVAEVISPYDNATEIQERIDDWLKAGTAVVWAVYSSLKTVVVWRAIGLAERRTADDNLDAEPAIPGFRCKVGELFED